jgi:prepilin-type N-terminal cleavage/methylation domain-containing protein
MYSLFERVRDERGFTLVEVLAATVILLIGILGTLAMIDSANSATAGNQNRSAANNLTRQIGETAKQVPYSTLTSTGVTSALQSQIDADPNTSGMQTDAEPGTLGWQIYAPVRPSDASSKVLTFTVSVSVCSVDDSKDGYGVHDPAIAWCGNSTGVTDTTPEDYKRVSITVTPPAGSGVSKPVTHTEIVANDRLDGSAMVGLGSGSALIMNGLCGGCNSAAWTQFGQVAPCKTFTVTVGTDKCNPSFDGTAQTNYSGNSITSVPFKAIWATAPASVKFFLNDYPTYYFKYPGSLPPDTLLGSATVDPANSRVWNYTWALANTYPNQTPDGFYGVKAVAYDSNGVQIDQQAMSMWLNRFIPDMKAWTSPNTGRNALFCTGTCPGNAKPDVEWAWAASPCSCRRDADIQNFKVYRTGTATVVCTLSEFNWRAPGAVVTSFYGLFNYSFVGCQDNTTPATSGVVTDTLKATSYSPDALAETEGGNLQPASASVNAANTRPCGPGAGAPPTCSTPGGLSVTWTGASGALHFMKYTWTVPNGRGDNDAGDCVVAFRVYQSASAAATPLYTDRLYQGHTPSGVASTSPCTGTATTSWTAFTAGGYSAARNKAFVTSVDSHLDESLPVSVTIPAPPP